MNTTKRNGKYSKRVTTIIKLCHELEIITGAQVQTNFREESNERMNKMEQKTANLEAQKAALKEQTNATGRKRKLTVPRDSSVSFQSSVHRMLVVNPEVFYLK